MRAAKKQKQLQKKGTYEVVVPGTYALVSLAPATVEPLPGVYGFLCLIAPEDEQDSEKKVGYMCRQWCAKVKVKWLYPEGRYAKRQNTGDLQQAALKDGTWKLWDEMNKNSAEVWVYRYR